MLIETVAAILTDMWRERTADKEWEANSDVRLDPDAIAKVMTSCFYEFNLVLRGNSN
jgi:hypothetical protein